MFAPPPLPRTLQASVRDLSSTKPATRASAAADLVRHAASSEETRAMALPLLEKALGDDSAIVRSAVCVALADLRAKEALPALLVAVEDVDVHTRQMAINALGEIGDVRAGPRLRRALTDPRPDVRYQAVIAFTRIVREDCEEVVRALARALDDEHESVRYIALRVAEERIDEDTHAGLEPLAARVVPLVADPVPHVALVAAIYLAKVGRSEGHTLLENVVCSTGRYGRAGPEKEDEREAVEMAGALGLRETIPALERRAWGALRVVRDTCAFHAKIALARMGHDRAVKEILTDLGSSKRQVREAAVVAAGRARLVQARATIEKLEGRAEPLLVQHALAELRRAESKAKAGEGSSPTASDRAERP